ncbi:efflux RND transporter periplasmic adaptor subunit, partial [Bacteroides pyogenes]|uniref:efflux RND transporter periplasmic adaptor subunit n=1 Tax=Bacteroides pyogenes TaxID=310300 RepID=UPI002FDA8376
VSVSASGKVVPAFEEIINSPINSRIVEVYKKGGDSVDAGTPILKLDLQSTETEYKKLLDEEQMRRYKLDQLRVNNQTKLSDMAMQIKVSAMKLDRMKVELRNERYLDSLGAGTTDKVRQAELSYHVAVLEYEQLKQQYSNEREIASAELKVQELDFNIFRKSLAEMKRTFEDAQIRSPRKAILTYINNQIGAQISKGSQVAVISDLSHFKVEGEIADTYGDRVAAGGKVIVKIGSEKLEGVVSSVTPLSKNGVISFTVQLNDDHNRRLRSGLKTDVYVMNAVKEDVMRIANGSFYVGSGEYELFVRASEHELVKRKVQLGESNFEYVEVIGGLKPGDVVVVSDMSSYKNKNKLKLR